MKKMTKPMKISKDDLKKQRYSTFMLRKTILLYVEFFPT